MSVKADLETVVTLQNRELELGWIDRDLKRIEQEREALKGKIAAAEQGVASTEEELGSSRSEVRRLELDLQSAEEKVRKYRDQLLAVKKNEELWALQKEIDAAEDAVGDIETRILEHMEKADALEAAIGVRRGDLEEVTKGSKLANAEADRREADLKSENEVVRDSIEELRSRLPEELLRRYEGVKNLRGEIAVAQADAETCLVCNVKLRPQLYVETANLSEIVQCENCNRILYVADRIDVPGIVSDADAEPAAEPAVEPTT